MAVAANVPLLCGSLDFKRRRGVILGLAEVTGDIGSDMDRIRALYAEVQGRNPERMVPVRLSSEGEE